MVEVIIGPRRARLLSGRPLGEDGDGALEEQVRLVAAVLDPVAPWEQMRTASLVRTSRRV
jgi:hypothetical protein